MPFTVPGVPHGCYVGQWDGEPSSHWMVGTWNPPTNDGGATVDYYRINFWGYGNAGFYGPYDVPSQGDKLFQKSQSYLPYGDYLFSVQAHNAAGLGPACTVIGTLYHPERVDFDDAAAARAGRVRDAPHRDPDSGCA